MVTGRSTVGCSSSPPGERDDFGLKGGDGPESGRAATHGRGRRFSRCPQVGESIRERAQRPIADGGDDVVAVPATIMRGDVCREILVVGAEPGGVKHGRTIEETDVARAMAFRLRSGGAPKPQHRAGCDLTDSIEFVPCRTRRSALGDASQHCEVERVRVPCDSPGLPDTCHWNARGRSCKFVAITPIRATHLYVAFPKKSICNSKLREHRKIGMAAFSAEASQLSVRLAFRSRGTPRSGLLS